MMEFVNNPCSNNEFVVFHQAFGCGMTSQNAKFNCVLIQIQTIDQEIFLNKLSFVPVKMSNSKLPGRMVDVKSSKQIIIGVGSNT